MTQEQLAEAAGLSLNTLQRYESGLRWPRPANASKIAKALGVSERVIFEGLEAIETNPPTVDHLLKAMAEMQKELESLRTTSITSSEDQELIQYFHSAPSGDQIAIWHILKRHRKNFLPRKKKDTKASEGE